MNYKIFIIIALVASILLSGCIENNNPADRAIQTPIMKDVKVVGNINGIDLYQARIDSINATCIYGTNNLGTARVDLFDCKYD